MKQHGENGCQAMTLSGYRTGQRCPNLAVVEMSGGKKLCLRHGGAEALARCIKAGDAKPLPTKDRFGPVAIAPITKES